MKPEVISAFAAFVSALSALATTYMFRKQGKGFIWTKDQAIKLGITPEGSIHLGVEIPIYNLGLGNVRFTRLRVKKVVLKSGAVEHFEMEFDEAYFPPNVQVIKYQTNAYSDEPPQQGGAISSEIRINKIDLNQINERDLQAKVNAKLAEIGEVVFVLKCEYRDGSWFGLGTRTTIIGMSLRGIDLGFLSVQRRKELNNLFSW